MTRSQEALLLTVARIMRAKIRNEIPEQRDDLRALNDALAPFDPTPAQKEILAQFEERRGSISSLAQESTEEFFKRLDESGMRKGGGY